MSLHILSVDSKTERRVEYESCSTQPTQKTLA